MVHGRWSIVLDELFWATCGKWQRRLAAERTEPRRLCHYCSSKKFVALCCAQHDSTYVANVIMLRSS